MYLHQDCDMVYICGDINSRLETIEDYIPYIDCVPERTVINTVKNSHGTSVSEFLNVAF